MLLFTCNYVVYVQRGFIFLLVLGTGCDILLWHSLGLPYNYFHYAAHFRLFAIGSQLSPETRSSGIEMLETDTFKLHCHQTMTGTENLCVGYLTYTQCEVQSHRIKLY